MKLWTFIALILVLSSVSVLNAQAVRLRGTVLDPSGAVIPGVDLRISQGSNVVASGKTDETGNFSFDVSPGEYRVEAAADGFRTRQQNVRAAANMRPLSITL